MNKSPIDLAVLALKDRVKRQAGHNPNRIKGCVAIQAIPNWEDKIEHMLMKALVSVSKGFQRSRLKQRETPLTVTATRISTAVLPYNEDRSIEEKLVVGALFLEAMHKSLLVELVSPVIKGMPYLVKWGKRTSEVFDKLADKPELSGVVFEKPEDTTTNLRTWKTLGDIEVSRNCIKRSTHKVFEFDPEAQWVKSLDKQQQTPLRINTDMFQAMLDNMDLFTADVSKLDEVDRISALSKQLAFGFTMSKATAILEKGTFYSMMDTDYRGRFYHIESFMNFQGDDRARSLIQFDEPKEITEAGKKWIAIHVACLYNETLTKDSEMSWCNRDEYIEFMDANSQDTISVDKMRLDDRAAWTYHNTDKIRELAERKEFDLDAKGNFKAEKPCQYLAACIEWNNLLKAEEAGEVFYTRLPIAIDGSNNGWQHLAAMSLDKQAGKLVGMVKSTLPKDFYLSTAKDMMDNMDDDVLKSILDKMSMAEIRKGISKRGSMVKAYSAGKGAIADNMWDDVRQIGYDKKFGITEENCKEFAKRLDKSIYNVCPGPLTVMKWFQQLSLQCMGTFKWVNEVGDDVTHRRKQLIQRRSVLSSNYILGADGDVVEDDTGRWIKKSLTEAELEQELDELAEVSVELGKMKRELKDGEGNRDMCWKSPSGFPIMMENFLVERSSVRIYIDGFPRETNSNGINLVVLINTETPDTRSFVSGIAPNFVHSMDAAHLSTVSTKHSGSFLGIHDSFSTHATDVDELVMHTKNTFIEMYSYKDILEDLKHQVLNEPDEFEIDTPQPGDLDLNCIRESDYFFA